MVSNNFSMSPSRTHNSPSLSSFSIWVMALCVDLRGRYAKLQSKNSCSNIGDMTRCNDCWIILSLIADICECKYIYMDKYCTILLWWFHGFFDSFNA